MKKTGRPKTDPEAIKRFSNTLNQVMDEQQLTQADVANGVPTNQQNVSNWCTGRSMPNRQHLIQLAEFLGRTVDSLKGGHRKKMTIYPDEAKAEAHINEAVIRKIAETFSEAEVSMTVDALNGIRRNEGISAVDHLVIDVGWCINNEGIARKWNVDDPQGYIDKLKALSETEAEAFIALVIRFWNAPTYHIPSVADRLREVGLVQDETKRGDVT